MSALMLLREDVAGVAVLTLNQPQSRNTLSEAMLETLGDALTAIAHDESVRAVVLAANGPAYCAGHDLKELSRHRSQSDGGRAYFKHIMTMCSTMMQEIVTLPQPVIAAVQGPASAAGCQLVASCDLAIASRAAKFATPGVHIGLFCSTPMVALSRDVSRKHAMEMLLTGDLISAEEAARIGLVNRVVAAGRERDDAIKLARGIAEKSSLTVRIGKEGFYRQLDMPLAEAYEYVTGVMVENMLKRDAEEGIDAFIDKRTPKWEDR
jgi:enoyl-CoA hydratase/carnithine racemase